jgi:hypothetical protein
MRSDSADHSRRDIGRDRPFVNDRHVGEDDDPPSKAAIGTLVTSVPSTSANTAAIVWVV